MVVCRKCGEEFVPERVIDSFICHDCNIGNWQPGDKLIAIKDSEPKKWYKKGDVFTIKDFKSETFHPEEDFRSYDNKNFKLYKEENMNFKQGDKVIIGSHEGIFETYLSKELDDVDCIIELCSIWNRANSADLKLYVPEPKPKYAIGDMLIGKFNDGLEIEILFILEKNKGVLKDDIYPYVVRHKIKGGEFNEIIFENDITKHFKPKEQKCTFDE